jgi:hypothetical protein
MRDLKGQLARYGEYLLETTPTATFEPDPVRVVPPAGSEPPSNRSVTWRAVAVIATAVAVAIGAGGFLLFGDGESGTAPVVDDGPTPPSTSPSTIPPASTTVPTTPETTALPPTTPSPTADAFPNRWTLVELGPWAVKIIDAEALPDGGFVLTNWAPDSSPVFWSPDGVDWFDGDPRGLLPDQLGATPGFPNSEGMAVVGDRVVLLDWRMSVWVGDPRTGDWQEIPLQVEDGEEGDFYWGGVRKPGLTLTSNGSQVLVAGAHDLDAGGELVMWLVDPLELTSVRVPTLATPPLPQFQQIVWFDGRWLIGVDVMVGESDTDDWGDDLSFRGMLWSSTDAVSWTEANYPRDNMGILMPRGQQLFVHLPAWGGGHLWVTSDLIEWRELDEAAADETDFVFPDYSGDLGYLRLVHYPETLDYFGSEDVDRPGPGEIWLVVSDDGTNWTLKCEARSDEILAISDGRVLFGGCYRCTRYWLLTNEEP